MRNIEPTVVHDIDDIGIALLLNTTKLGNIYMSLLFCPCCAKVLLFIDDDSHAIRTFSFPLTMNKTTLD